MGPTVWSPRNWPGSAWKERLQSEEDLGRKVTALKLGTSKDFSDMILR